MDCDSLEYLPLERWSDLQDAFKADWPRGISGYAALEVQKQWKEQNVDYDFKVYCPFGDVRSGMVAFNIKEKFYEVIIQCPSENTEKLKEALIKTKVIDWDQTVVVPYASRNVIKCLEEMVQHVGVGLNTEPRFLNTFILERDIYGDVSLPPNMSFGPVRSEHLDLVDSTWPNRYPGSKWHFQLLINTNSGYGLFLNNELVSWVFIKEVGPLQHLFTVEEHRKKGYGELVMKLAAKVWLKEEKPVFAFCFKDNVNACKVYRKLGFIEGEQIAWCYLSKKKH